MQDKTKEIVFIKLIQRQKLKIKKHINAVALPNLEYLVFTRSSSPTASKNESIHPLVEPAMKN